jgi:hypothetical protein
MNFALRIFLIQNGLKEFITVFEENNLDSDMLPELTMDDYRKLGIPEDAADKIMGFFSAPSNLVSSQSMQGLANNIPAASTNQVTTIKTGNSPVPDSPVHNILTQNGLSEYVPIFDRHKLIDFDVISKLTEGELSELGIHAIGDRKKIKELFHITEKKEEDSNVVVTQTVKSEGTNTAGIVVSILVGAVLICIVLYYAIPRFLL